MTRARLLRPVVVIPVVVVLVGVAVWLGFKSGNGAAANTQAATQQLFTVAPTTMNQTVSASGTIAPADTENLSFTVAGTVESVAVKAGQTVKKGQVLATVGSAALLSEVAQANAALKAAQASLSDDQNAGASSAQIANDQAGVTTAYSNLLSATSDLNGATLTSPISGTVATVNLSVGDVLTASGSTGANLSGTGTNSGRTNTSSSSSSSGANNSGANNSGANSSSANNGSSSAQFTVISSNYVVNLSVDTSTIGNLKVGETATVTPTSASGTSSNSGAGRFGGFGFLRGGGGAATDVGGGGGGGGTGSNTGSNAAATATGDAATGTVTSVGTIASSSSGVATFPVVVTVTGTPPGFHAGATASTVIAYKTLANVLAVPALAVTCTNGESSVTVSTNGSTSRRVVTTGITSGAQVQITSGLQSGEQVVVTIPVRRTTTGSGSNGSGGRSQFPGGGQFPGGFRGGLNGAGLNGAGG